jgi:hypothetical protein
VLFLSRIYVPFLVLVLTAFALACHVDHHIQLLSQKLWEMSMLAFLEVGFLIVTAAIACLFSVLELGWYHQKQVI